MTSYDGMDTANVDPVYGIQLHQPRFLEFIGAPESARLLNRSPAYWIKTMDREDAVAAALQLQRDASLMTSNLGQFATSLNRMSCEVLRLAISSGGRLLAGAPSAPCRKLYVCYGIMAASGVARVIPRLCRSHLVIAVLTVQTVFRTSLVRLCYEYSRWPVHAEISLTFMIMAEVRR